MNAILHLHDNAMSEEGIQELTFELKNSVNQHTDLTAQLPEEAGGVGTKGDPVTIGQILLAAVGGGGAIATLMPVLQTYFERKPSIKIELDMGDGRTLKFEAEHMQPEQIQQTMQDIKQLVESGNDKGNG
jgi:hypothetical protein